MELLWLKERIRKSFENIRQSMRLCSRSNAKLCKNDEHFDPLLDPTEALGGAHSEGSGAVSQSDSQVVPDLVGGLLCFGGSNLLPKS